MRKPLLLLIFVLVVQEIIAKESQMYELIGFIENNSDYSYTGTPLPTVQVMSNESICKEFKLTYPCDIAGYYDNRTDTIAIATKPTGGMVEENFYEVVLIHELVHYLQYHNGYYDVVECKQQLESDAFRLQDEYIDHMGYDPANKNDPLFALMASMCRGQNGYISGSM